MAGTWHSAGDVHIYRHIVGGGGGARGRADSLMICALAAMLRCTHARSVMYPCWRHLRRGSIKTGKCGAGSYPRDPWSHGAL